MRKIEIILAIIILFGSGLGIAGVVYSLNGKSEGFQELEFEDIQPNLSRWERVLYERFPEVENWQRPAGPIRIGLQAGHWKNNLLPDELERLRGTSLGTRGGGKEEWELNLELAQLTSDLLKEYPVVIEILPATILSGYLADVFVAIHADGNPNTTTAGFKASGPWRDVSGRSQELVDIFYATYPAVTGLGIDENITHNMRGYYAFNWFRNEHALHPMTPAIILETGFLTSPRDQRILIDRPEIAAQAIAEGIITFLNLEPGDSVTTTPVLL